MGAPVASNSRGQITSKLTIPRSTSVAPVLEFLRAPRARLITWLPVGKLPSAAPTNQRAESVMAPAKMARKNSHPCLGHCTCQIWIVPENEFLKLIYLSRAMASTSCNIWMDRSMGASNADTRKILPDTRKLLESCTDTRILGLTPRKHGWGLEAGERGAFSGDAKILGR